LLKVPHSTIRHAQNHVGDDLDVKRATGGGQGEGALACCAGLVILAYDREGVAQIGGDPSESLGVVQPLGKRLGRAQVVQDPRVFTKRQ
jgi:hypothetical protein